MYEFDQLIIATHSDQALKILGEDATEREQEILGKIPYSPNIAYLHRDESLMPVNQKAWSAWNYLTTAQMEKKSQSMCLTYWMNRLQSVIDPKVYGNVFVTMNPLWKPENVIETIEYDHPVYSIDVILAN
jgi:predicted NAD/FAD-binding protein